MEKDLNLKDQMIQSLKWSGISHLLQYGLQFIFVAVLARILFPEDFGLIAVIMIFVELGLNLRDLGLGTALVQRKEIKDAHLTTTFYICILLGITFFIILISSAHLVSEFFHKDILNKLIIIISFKFILYSLSVVHEFMLIRNLLFKKLAFVTTGESLTYGIAAIAMVSNGLGVSALVYAQLIGGFVRVVLAWNMYKWQPSLRFDSEAFKEIFGFAKNWLGFKVVNYLKANLERFFLGKFLGMFQLGFYSLAYGIANFPQEKLSSMVGRIGFSAFSKIQDNQEKLKTGYLNIVGYVSAVTFPLLMGLLVISHQFVTTVYSAKWIPMITPLRILCLAGVFFSITELGGIIILSIGRADITLKFSLYTFFLRLAAVVLGMRFGLDGVAIGIAIYSLVLNILTFLIVRRLVNVSTGGYLQSLLPSFLSSVIMVVVLWIFMRFESMYLSLSDIPLLVGLICLGAVIYFLSLFFIKKTLIIELIQILHRMI